MNKMLSSSMSILMQINSIEVGKWIWFWCSEKKPILSINLFDKYKKTWAKKISSIKRSDILHHHIYTLFCLKCENIKIHLNNKKAIPEMERPKLCSSPLHKYMDMITLNWKYFLEMAIGLKANNPNQCRTPNHFANTKTAININAVNLRIAYEFWVVFVYLRNFIYHFHLCKTEFKDVRNRKSNWR